jgi:hypothetical protein
MLTQAEKGAAFVDTSQARRHIHYSNPWDPGSARLLNIWVRGTGHEHCRICLSRSGSRQRVGREATLAHAASVAAGTDLPSASIWRTGLEMRLSTWLKQSA